MRGQKHVFQLEISLVEFRFVFVHVEACCPNALVAQGFDQRCIINNAATRHVDQHRRALHHLQLFSTDIVMRFLTVRQYQQDDIRFLEQVFLAHVLHAQFLLDLRRNPVTRVIQNRHVEATNPLRDRSSDTTKADNAERCAVNVMSQRLLEPHRLPLAGTQVTLALPHAPAGRNHQPDRIIGNAVIEHSGRIGHHHATLGTGLHVDVVVADRGVANHFECRATIEQFAVNTVA